MLHVIVEMLTTQVHMNPWQRSWMTVGSIATPKVDMYAFVMEVVCFMAVLSWRAWLLGLVVRGENVRRCYRVVLNVWGHKCFAVLIRRIYLWGNYPGGLNSQLRDFTWVMSVISPKLCQSFQQRTPKIWVFLLQNVAVLVFIKTM